MSKHWNTQHWRPGFQRDNRQNAYNGYQNFQGNMSQNNNSYYNQSNYAPNASNYYGDSSFHTNYTQNSHNNHFERGFHRNFPQIQSSHNQNFQRDNFATNGDFNQTFQKNIIQQSSNSNNNFNAQCDLSQNDSTINTRKNTTYSKSNPWHKNPPTSCDKRRKKYQGVNSLNNYYDKKIDIFNDKGYLLNEYLYRDPSSFYGNNKSNVPVSNNESNDNWTDKFWQKHDGTGAPEHSGMSQSTGTVSRKNQNRLERTLNDMLAKPAEMSKGKSLLQKMGWQGGGLGKAGDGIVEPIAPKATYAVNTMGLGHPTEKPSNSNNTFIVQSQNDSTTNTRKNTNKSKNNPWLENPPTSSKKQRKQCQVVNSLEDNDKETDIFNDKGYITKENLYRDPSLFYANNKSNESVSNNESNDDWTDTFWQKHDGTGTTQHSGMSQNTGTVSRKNQNRLERTLNDMLAKPAEMSKGKSLLQKMGWQGGGLGKAGDGIVEPIAPKATYAVNAIGLGHTTEKPRKPLACVKKKKLRQGPDNFYTNVLLYILEFVRNDEENKIVFGPRLRKLERKRIHHIVERIRESDNLDDFEIFYNFSDKQFELVKEIWVHNCYELWTESEGDESDRRLYLYKEAPAHVYLVTPEDLTEKDESNIIDDKNEKDNDISVHNIKKEKDPEYSDTGKGNITEAINYEENCNGNQETDIKYDCTDKKIDKLLHIKKEIADPTDFQIDVDINMDENNQIVIKSENNGEKIIQNINYMDLHDKIIPKTEINEQFIVNSHENHPISTKMATNIDSCNKNIEQNNDKTDEIMEDNNEITVKKEINSEEFTDINMCDEIKVKMEINEQLKTDEKDRITGEVISDNSKNINIKQEIDKNEEYIKKEDKKDATNSILAKIVKYFKEFSSDAIFKEFRFLGPFDSEEIMHINMFFNICMKLDEIECDEKMELLAAFDNDSVNFDVLEDNNGKRFIQKVANSPELPSADDDVICID